MPNPYKANVEGDDGTVKLSGKIEFTDPANQPGGTFNGGTITGSLNVAPAASSGPELTVTAAAGQTGDLLNVLNENTYGLFVDATGGVVMQGDAASNNIALNVKQFAVGQTVLRLQGTGATVFEVGEDSKLGFFGHAPAVQPTGVAVTAAAIHAALVSLGLITA